jgi:hypothetical protein
VANLVVNQLSDKKEKEIVKIWGSLRRFGIFSVEFIPEMRRVILQEILADAKKSKTLDRIVKLTLSLKTELRNSMIDTEMCELEMRSRGLTVDDVNWFLLMRFPERSFLYEHCRLYWEPGRQSGKESDILSYLLKI